MLRSVLLVNVQLQEGVVVEHRLVISAEEMIVKKNVYEEKKIFF